jgi:hypothetical protein
MDLTKESITKKMEKKNNFKVIFFLKKKKL